MEESARRDFKGVWIPREVWLNKELSALDKIILAEIDSLDNEQHCIAGNNYIAKFCQCSESKVSKSVKKLIEMGYVKQLSFDGRQRVLQSCLAFFTRQDSKNCEAESEKMPAINIGISKDIKKVNKEIRHKHGEYSNVLLTDEELSKLKAEFPDDWERRIERLSEYMASTGKSYKNHLATIRNWARRDREKEGSKSTYKPSDETEWDF